MNTLQDFGFKLLGLAALIIIGTLALLPFVEMLKTTANAIH